MKHIARKLLYQIFQFSRRRDVITYLSVVKISGTDFTRYANVRALKTEDTNTIRKYIGL